MSLKVGDRAVVAFSAPCCGLKLWIGEVIVISGLVAGNDGVTCCTCGKQCHELIALFVGRNGIRYATQACRLVRLPPDGETAPPTRVVKEETA